MQHHMAILTCPACQGNISVQLALQLHEEQQQQQRRRQLLESQTTILESLKILDQGQEADRQGDFEKAFRLCKIGLAGAILALKLWPAVTNPMAPMIDQSRSRVMWAMGRSEKISKVLAAWAQVTEHPLPMMIQAFKVGAQLPAADFAPDAAPSSGPRHNNVGVALGTTQGEQLAQLQPLQAAQLPQPMHPEMQQQKQVAQQQAQQPQQVAQQQAQQQVAQEPQQQRRQPVVIDLVTLALQQKQQQQQLQEQQQQQPKHQQLQDQALGALRSPREPLGPPPQSLLQAIKSKAVSKDMPKAMPNAAKFTAKWLPVGHVEGHGSGGVASGVAHKKQRVEMPKQEKEEHEEADVDAWSFLKIN